MTNEQLIEKFNPDNAASMTPADLEIMRALNDQQIDVLANAYPNQPTRRTYLRLYDKTVAENKQLFQMSTWQNLRNNRKFSNKKNLIPWDFQPSNIRTRTTPSRPTAVSAKQIPKRVVVDMTAKEAAEELTRTISNQKAAEQTKDITPPVKPTTKKVAASKKLRKPTEQPAKEVQEKDLPADQQFGDGL